MSEAPRDGVLALDVGYKKTGIAKLLGGVVLPVGVIQGGRDKQWTSFLPYLAEPPALILLGLPKTSDGGLSLSYPRVIWWKTRLEKQGLKVEMVNEAFSSAEARALLDEAGLPHQQEDAYAAMILIKRYLANFS